MDMDNYTTFNTNSSTTLPLVASGSSLKFRINHYFDLFCFVKDSDPLLVGDWIAISLLIIVIVIFFGALVVPKSIKIYRRKKNVQVQAPPPTSIENIQMPQIASTTVTTSTEPPEYGYWIN